MKKVVNQAKATVTKAKQQVKNAVKQVKQQAKTLVQQTKQAVKEKIVAPVKKALQPKASTSNAKASTTNNRKINSEAELKALLDEHKQTRVLDSNGEPLTTLADKRRVLSAESTATPDGRTINVRPKSSGGYPTTEIYDLKNGKSIKIRY